MLPILPKSLEEKWAWALREDPSLAWYRDCPERILYLSQKEREFLYRAKHPKEFHFISCLFCKKEGMWSDFGLGIHVGQCKSFKEYLERRAVTELLGKKVITRSLRTVRTIHIAEEDAFHRHDIVEFSGGAEENEAELIHRLLEDADKWAYIGEWR